LAAEVSAARTDLIPLPRVKGWEKIKSAPRRGAFNLTAGELYYQVQHFRGIKRSSYRPMVE
jgi:hypothetical protein